MVATVAENRETVEGGDDEETHVVDAHGSIGVEDVTLTRMEPSVVCILEVRVVDRKTPSNVHKHRSTDEPEIKERRKFSNLPSAVSLRLR